MDNSSVSAGKQITTMVLYGVATVALYTLLYLFEDSILKSATQGGWYFWVPVLIAFVFSFAHGAFTSHFWDVLGFKAKK